MSSEKISLGIFPEINFSAFACLPAIQEYLAELSVQTINRYGNEDRIFFVPINKRNLYTNKIHQLLKLVRSINLTQYQDLPEFSRDNFLYIE